PVCNENRVIPRRFCAQLPVYHNHPRWLPVTRKETSVDSCISSRAFSHFTELFKPIDKTTRQCWFDDYRAASEFCLNNIYDLLISVYLCLDLLICHIADVVVRRIKLILAYVAVTVCNCSFSGSGFV